MRGYAKFNFPAFDAAAALGHLLHWDCISPADLDRKSGINEDTCPQMNDCVVRAIVKRDVEAILSLRAEDGDAIALLPGWRKSTGANGEVALGIWLGLTFLDAQTFEPIQVSITAFEINPPTGDIHGIH
jgi:hypothetical protein